MTRSSFTTPNVAADSNGFFHPLGDHAQVSYVIDGQPISDQRNKVFSTSIPENAIQSMEMISGSPAAEYGDKTRSCGQRKHSIRVRTEDRRAQYSFTMVRLERSANRRLLVWAAPHRGNFAVLNTERTGRFLDTPEFWPMHDVGNTGTFSTGRFSTTGKDSFHLDLLAARNWLQIPNTYDQPNQDQKQKVISFNIAPGYQRTINAGRCHRERLPPARSASTTTRAGTFSTIRPRLWLRAGG